MKKIYSFLVILLGLSSCASSQVVTILSPEAPEGHFHMGREYINLSNGQVRVELGFDGIYEESLVFDVVVLNNTTQPLSFNPSEFYYVILDSSGADSSRFPPGMAIHPDKVLHLYEKSMEDAEIDKNINSIFGIVETGIGIIASAAAIMAKENPGYIVDALFSTVGTADHYVNQGQRISHNLEEISMEKEVISEEILREGRIPPGKAVSGFVYFPKYPGTGTIMFCFPLEDQLFQFVYNQHI